MTLTEINNSFEEGKRTDKSRHGYLNVYENYFSVLKEKLINLLEIGVCGGDSLRLWEKYFINANIFGIEKDPNVLALFFERAKVFCADQSDIRSLKEFSSDKCFDIIIDDGSHYSPHQILSFEILFEKLNSDGLYIVEDLQCCYDQSFGFFQERSINYFLKLVHFLNFRGKVKLANEYKEFDYLFKEYDGRFSFIHFYPHCVIIKKR